MSIFSFYLEKNTTAQSVILFQTSKRYDIKHKLLKNDFCFADMQRPEKQ